MNCHSPYDDYGMRNQRLNASNGLNTDLNTSARHGSFGDDDARLTMALQSSILARSALGLGAIGQTTPFLPGPQTLQVPRHRDLSFTTQDAAKRSVMELLAHHNTPILALDDCASLKAQIKLLPDLKIPLKKHDVPSSPPFKKRAFCTEDEDATCEKKSPVNAGTAEIAKSLEKTLKELANKRFKPAEPVIETNTADSLSPIEESEQVSPAEEGAVVEEYNDNDVLCGRGGGTNVHPGNRRFRDLIHAHRCRYLKAKKNDKPAISRSIVAAVRRANGRFLKKDEKTGKWVEIGDDGAREKTSQALRQRAPEMRRILFEGEQRMAEEEIRRRGEEAAAVADAAAAQAAAGAAAQRAQLAAAAAALSPPTTAHHGASRNATLSLPALQATANALNTNTQPLATELAKTALFQNALMMRQQQCTNPNGLDLAATALLARRIAMLRGAGVNNFAMNNNP
uniref:DUF6824 domain-containing protein n=1 Tax=Ditylum brightwellii TaxID=49249 RepID=A0A7S4T0V1_9STRA|mmetsp:Transcript_50985/g.76392  ORF Transcript_50985/g.76392 Transcript_50985/m.76392 type:complete len:455 (+) Transcript_50985:44-1408(+)